MLSKKIDSEISVGLPFQSHVVSDFDETLDTMNGDRELLGEISRMFLEDAPLHMQCIKVGLAQGNINEIRHRAHMLIGMVSVFSAERARSAAICVEESAGQDGCGLAVNNLEAALVELQSVVQSYS